MKKGFVAIFMVLLVFVTIVSILAVFLIRQEIGFLKESYYNLQAYYLAESGIEDALLRIKNDPTLSDFSYSFGNIQVNILENIGGVLTIISKGEYSGAVQRIKVRYQIDLEKISFHYGAQAGQEGIVMRNNSKIIGNVFSNGSILGGQGAEITETAVIAGEKIERVKIGKDLKTHNCYNSQVQGDLFYVLEQSCSVQGQVSQISEIEPGNFPISEKTIQKWKQDAKQGEIIENNYSVSGIDFLGPAHIKGNLEVQGGASLKLQGNVLVSGDLTIYNNAVLELDSNYYHNLSGIIIVEGKTRIRPGAVLRGSGQEGSYLMIVSLNSSLEDAVQIDNTSDAGIFYAPYGAVLLNQRVKIREVTAYKIILQENAIVEYEIGLANMFFSSGSGGSWEILSWEKID